MAGRRKARDVFDEWARNKQSDRMARDHWPRVGYAFSLIPEIEGDFLEIGVGNGYGILEMAVHQFKRGLCFGIDISPEMVVAAKERVSGLDNVTIEEGDFLTWSPPAKTHFSLIFSMEVFYYFQNIQTGIERSYSFLEPGGQMWVLVNYYKENESSHSWPDMLDTPMSLWSKLQYLEGFEKAGFRDVQQHLITGAETINAPGNDFPTLWTRGTKK
jgi:SAM-dependent methyltransferase